MLVQKSWEYSASSARLNGLGEYLEKALSLSLINTVHLRCCQGLQNPASLLKAFQLFDQSSSMHDAFLCGSCLPGLHQACTSLKQDPTLGGRLANMTSWLPAEWHLAALREVDVSNDTLSTNSPRFERFCSLHPACARLLATLKHDQAPLQSCPPGTQTCGIACCSGSQ